MQAKRFIAADMRRALDMVKNEFGEDAMIMSTERTSKGVELVATAEAPIENGFPGSQSLATNVSTPMTKVESTPPQQPQISPSLSQAPVVNNSVLGLASGKTKDQLAQEMDIANRKMLAARKADSLTLEQWADQETTKQPPSHAMNNVQHHQNLNNEKEIKHLQNEISSMRDTIEIQLSQMAENQDRQYQESLYREQEYREERFREQEYREQESRDLQYREQQYREEQSREKQAKQVSDQQEQHLDNVKTDNLAMPENISPQLSSTQKVIIPRDIRQHFDAIGLTRQCSERLLTALNELDDKSPSKQKIWTKLLTSLAQRIPSDTTDAVAKGGIYAFLGTTGVGKTTTIAKLAARYVIENGPDNVVLLTTDNYRIASHNQLRSLGKILNIRVRVVEDLNHLPNIVDEYRDTALVLIDTPGMSVSDPLLKPHLSAIKQCRGVQNLLVLSASSQYQMMKASLHSYRAAGLKYCVMTKLDECASLGDAISVMSEHQLPLAYITDGQSVPDDIDVLKSAQLVSRAVTKSKEHYSNRQQAH